MTAGRKIAISQPATGEEEWLAVREPLETGWLTQGPKVAAFEREFAKLCGAPHALAATSCTTALHLILAALEIGPGDEVIVPSFTWVATANVVLYCHATPVIVDVDPRTYNIDPAAVQRALTPRTKAIIAVHLFGLCADIDEIARVAPGIPLIEDAACATGSVYKGRPAGSLARAAAFSFHPRKSITTGEGGMVTTRDAALAETISQLRNHGASVSDAQRHEGPQPYLLPAFNLLGFNYRMTDVQAAIGLVQLGKLERMLAERERWAEYYRRELADVAWLRVPVTPAGDRHGLQAFVCWVDEARAPRPRNELMAELEHKGIATRPGTHAIHMLGYYRERFGYHADALPGARDCDRYTLTIPLHNRMTADDYAYVVEALHALR